MKQTRREFVRTLFVASQAAAVGSLLPVNLLAEPARTNALNFLVFGDWGRSGEQDQVEVAAQMAKAAGAIGAKFIISVGDNFYEYGVKSTEDKHWRVSFENVYSAQSLQVPWHVILGNHDYCGNCQAQLEYGKTHPRWNMPARYFKQTHVLDRGATADFFYLDTTPMVKEYYRYDKTRKNVSAENVPRQLAWLRRALAASRAQWKMVIGHHPIYSGGDHGGTAELVENLLPILQNHGVQVYFNGHDHDLQHLVAGEVNMFDSGAGSQFRQPTMTPHTKFAAGSSGFTTVALTAEKMSVGMIDNRGKLLYATDVPRSSA